MNDINSGNKDYRHQNQVKGNNNHRSQGNRQQSQHHQNNRSHNGDSNTLPSQLLEELVQQNHTIIGLLRGIRHALLSGETYNSASVNDSPVHQYQRSDKTEQPIAKTNTEKQTTVQSLPTESKQSNEQPVGRPIQQKRQFVVRFDDKQPLKLDEDPIEVLGESIEEEDYIIPEDENSIGESNPFELFGKHGE